MKLSVSNIGWPFEKTNEAFRKLEKLGVHGIEIAPSKVWDDTWNISFEEVQKFRKYVESFHLEIVGLHSLLYDHPDYGLFKDLETEKKSIQFLSLLGKLCSDLGGKTLVYGSGPTRRKDKLTYKEAIEKAAEFFHQIALKMEEQKVIMCIEALGKNEADFINSARESLDLIKRVNNKGFLGQFDTKSLYAADEIHLSIFEEFHPYLVHVHVNDPGLVEVGSTGVVNHPKIGNLLKKIEYKEYISIEQKTINENNPFPVVMNSIEEVKKCYLSP